MSARKVSMHLKPDTTVDLTRKHENDIIPRLRKAKGFCDEIVFVASNKKDAIAIDLWDREDDAEAYKRGAYPDVQKSLGTLIGGTPDVETYEACNSTFHKIAVAV